MNRRDLLVGALATTFADTTLAVPQMQHKTEWSRFFTEADAQGSIVVLDARGGAGSILVFDAARAERRYSPASTFKIPHSLFDPVRTLAANIVLEIPYAEGIHRSSLFVSGLFLILVIFAMLCIAEWYAPETTVEN